VYRSVYACDACGAHEAHRHKLVRRYLSIHCRCPRCWSEHLEVFGKRDRIEGFHKSFLRRMQSWLGAPLYYCAGCRLQFYDARPRRRRDSVGHKQALEAGISTPADRRS
jgi:transposase-like protein